MELSGTDLCDLDVDGERWVLPVGPRTVNPRGVLYGGAPLAASITIAEALTGAPTRWATTHLLRPATTGDRVTLDATVEVAGFKTSQVIVRGTMPAPDAPSGDGSNQPVTVFETVMAVGAGRPDEESHQWVTMPDVPGPADAPPRPTPGANAAAVEARRKMMANTAVGRIEQRPALGRFPDGGEATGVPHIAFWARMPGEPSAAREVLAWLADCVPMAVAAATGRMPAGSSLDNTIRFGALDHDTEWVLVDVTADQLHHGYAYGRVALWTEDGTLLGTGSQTAIVKLVELPSGMPG